MISGFLKKIIGDRNEREIRKLWPIVHQINQHFEEFKKLSDAELRAKTDEFKQRLAEGETLDDLLPEAYAVVKEACRRHVGKRWMVTGREIEWDMVPFDVQLLGAIVLHQGKIAEMATGEGKTLVATMPLYLNALEGKGAHLVTVNDYLAQRDAEWMGKIFEFLGLRVGVILNNMDSKQRRAAYESDITYGTNNEFGFDYLRDNMAVDPDDIVQVKGHNYAIIDEVDSVLIDEARTPLIISGPVEHDTHVYDEVKPMVERLVKIQTRYVNSLIAEAERLLEEGKTSEAGVKLLIAQRGAPKNKRLLKLYQEPGIQKLVYDIESAFMRDKKMHELDEELYYTIDEKRNVIDITEKGRQELSPRNPEEFVLPDLVEEFSRIEEDSSLSPEEKAEAKNKIQLEYARKNEKIHNITQLLKAYSLFEKDVDYVVSDGKVLIVDEFTGRILHGRRYSDGLHQALEAKEGVKIARETQTLATITLQNYFRLYNKLAGMTGTAETEAQEFWDIYKLEVVVIPTNKPIRRIDHQDVIYRTKREKFNAVIDEVERLHRAGLPVLVGTISVETSETLSRMLKRRKIPHHVLNAKYHKQEAEIVAKAGQAGAVTIATNMAGRGTDIKLGPGVIRCQRSCPRFGEDRVPAPEGLSYEPCSDDTPCGLHIIGTERHEARRIDRQLRGRAGRQGDPGASRFFLSLEDDLMRLFGSDRVIKIMDRLGAQEGEMITHPMVTRAIERAQKRVEMQNFSIRKHLLEYDDVMNRQREVIYERRRRALLGDDPEKDIDMMMDEYIDALFEKHGEPKKGIEQWDIEALNNSLIRTLLVDLNLLGERLYEMTPDELRDYIKQEAYKSYEFKKKKAGEKLLKDFSKYIILRVIDENWKDHLHAMDMLKEGISLRAYAQKDPLIEYKQEAYNMFLDLVDTINQKTLEVLWTTEFVEIPSERKGAPPRMVLVHKDPTNMGLQAGAQPKPASSPQAQAARQRSEKPQPIKVAARVGRNDPCPCGSGKKYKKCCGA
ncbi:MAG: preprotein translocase subunit SecA [Calditrichaeota bacterium]|nr:MAG: preprotein translocase subunit SecA [Calditrichota bacterium]